MEAPFDAKGTDAQKPLLIASQQCYAKFDWFFNDLRCKLLKRYVIHKIALFTF